MKKSFLYLTNLARLLKRARSTRLHAKVRSIGEFFGSMPGMLASVFSLMATVAFFMTLMVGAANTGNELLIWMLTLLLPIVMIAAVKRELSHFGSMR